MFSPKLSVLRPTLIDSPYSTEPIEDWSNPVLERVDVPVAVEPLEAEETISGTASTWLTEAAWRVVSAPGYTLDMLGAADRVRVAGIDDDLEIDGPPRHWTEPLPHSEVRLKLTEGTGY